MTILVSLLAESMVSMMNVKDGTTSSCGKHSLIVSTACQLVNVFYLFFSLENLQLFI